MWVAQLVAQSHLEWLGAGGTRNEQVEAEDRGYCACGEIAGMR